MSDKRNELREALRELDNALSVAITDFARIEQLTTDPAVARAARKLINAIIAGDKETNEVARMIRADRWDLV